MELCIGTAAHGEDGPSRDLGLGSGLGGEHEVEMLVGDRGRALLSSAFVENGALPSRRELFRRKLKRTSKQPNPPRTLNSYSKIHEVKPQQTA